MTWLKGAKRGAAQIGLLLFLLATSRGWAQAPTPPAANLPALYIIGDSTVNNHQKMPALLGWGDPVKDLFDPTRIRVENRARGGRSARTFLQEGLWEAVVASLKPGDFVLMQFGHNDVGSLADPKGRADLRGTGNETAEATDPQTGAKMTVHTFGWYLRKFIADTRAHHATPIVVSMVPRNRWREGKIVRSAGDPGTWAQEVATGELAYFLPLNTLIADKYDPLGEARVKAVYFTPQDNTHTSPAGATLAAACVAGGLRALKGCPLAGYLRPQAPAPAPPAAP